MGQKGLSQSDSRILKLDLHIDTNSRKLKIDWKNQSGHMALKLRMNLKNELLE